MSESGYQREHSLQFAIFHSEIRFQLHEGEKTCDFKFGALKEQKVQTCIAHN